MKRLAWASLAFTTAAVIAVSCVPDFQFRKPDSVGGSGGGVMEDGGTPTTTSSGTNAAGAGGGSGGGGAGGAGGEKPDAGPPVVMVTCGTSAVECPPSEYCCWHESSAACDVCTQGGTCVAPSGLCGGLSNYRLLRCNGPEDCPSGQQCCEDITEDTLCAGSCGASQNIMCGGPQDCPMDKPYCRSYAPPYPGYMYCSATAP